MESIEKWTGKLTPARIIGFAFVGLILYAMITIDETTPWYKLRIPFFTTFGGAYLGTKRSK